MTPKHEAAARLSAAPERFRPILDGCAEGSIPPNIALMRLAMAAPDPDEVRLALEQAHADALLGPDGAEAAERLGRARSFLHDNPQAFDMVRRLLDGVDHADGPGPGGDDVARWADTFDRMARISPEGSVALYALGNPRLLEAATAEVVGRLRDWGLLGPGRRVLEIGCGIGRLVAAMAPEAGQVTGLDISPEMIARARATCGGLPNVTISLSSGSDLAGVPDRSVDLVLGSDVFPYLVLSGMAGRHVEEAARVLAPGGHLAILNFSYRGDFGLDREEAEGLAARHGLTLRRAAQGDFSLWDATTLLLAKP